MKKQLEDYLQPVKKPEGWSIHFRDGWLKRTRKAKEKVGESPVSPDILKEYCEDFVNIFRIEATVSRVDLDTSPLPNGRVIWLKLTKDNYVGVIGTGEVNFDMPSDKREYHEGKPGNWKWNTSGILCHYVKKEWEESFVIACQVAKLPQGLTLRELKRALGNYLQQEVGVPIIDHYNHQISKEG